jgi:hypothetical protein
MLVHLDDFMLSSNTVVLLGSGWYCITFDRLWLKEVNWLTLNPRTETDTFQNLRQTFNSKTTWCMGEICLNLFQIMSSSTSHVNHENTSLLILKFINDAFLDGEQINPIRLMGPPTCHVDMKIIDMFGFLDHQTPH